jgi:hypothetical protein
MDDFKMLRGDVEVIAKKNNKIFHYERSNNVVTKWAKHTTMHLLTGESFTTHGVQRSLDANDHVDNGVAGEGVNNDGTLLSGQQYFSNNNNPNWNVDDMWSKSTFTPASSLNDASDDPNSATFPFFPTKILLGTGFEFKTWDDIPDEYKSVYEAEGWDQLTFDSLEKQNSDNNYSNAYEGGAIQKTRTMNDIFSGVLSEPVGEEDFAVPGAIKNGLYKESDTQRSEYSGGVNPGGITITENGNEFLEKKNSGVGSPCFIYATRESRFFADGSEVSLNSDDNEIENKITFTVVLPEQTGQGAAGIFYPYNGYTLKVAGLFTDARMALENTVDPNNDIYKKMPHGILFAKKNISPVTKNHDVSLTIRWTIYL